MTEGINAAASGMVGILSLNDVISNNLANINTPGFKQSIVTFKSFKDVMVNKLDNSNDYVKPGESLGNLSAGSCVDGSSLDFKQGGIQTTGNPLDFAINGKGLFTVQTPTGTAYTRNGTFMINNQGQISTTEGYPVMGQSGPITAKINSGAKDVKILTDGTVQVNNQTIAKLKIVDFNNKNSLQPLGNSLYKPANGQTPVNATGFEIKQGALETSNANVVECMVNSINASRTYESCQKS